MGDVAQPYPGAVYAMRQGDRHGPIKFGFTSGNVFTRASQLQTGSALSITPMSWAPGTPDEERAIHAHFADFRMAGEWFFPAVRVVAAAEHLEAFIYTVRAADVPFPGLRAAYMVDGALVRTEEMSRQQVRKVLTALSQRAVEAGDARGHVLGATYSADPSWDEHPELCFGLALELTAMRHHLRAAA